MPFSITRLATEHPKANAYWKQMFGIDLRTLALVRVLLAIACLAQVFTLWPDVYAFFDDRALFPRSVAISRDGPYVWSFYYISGRVEWAYIILTATVLSSLALLVGYHARLAALVCWALTLSVTVRLTIFTSGAHMLLPILLFWAMFLPISARFSVDAALAKEPKGENAYVSIGTMALLLQVMCLYLFSGLLKDHPLWHTTGDAIYTVIHTATLPSMFGVYLGQWPELMRTLTFFVYYLELASVVVLFFPIKNAWFRLAIVPLLLSLHIGFVIFLAIGFFPFVCFPAALSFLPGLFWDKFLPWLNSRPKRKNIVLYYDEDCGFCRKTCAIFRELGLPSSTPILPAQQDAAIYAVMQRENSWVVKDGEGELRTRWEAVAWCWRRSPLLWIFGIIFLPRFMRPIGDAIYGFIAHNRPAFARLSGRFLKEHERKLVFEPWPVTQLFVGTISIMVLLWNIGSLPEQRPFVNKIREPMRVVLSTLGLTQQMGFFAPFPYRTARWIVVQGWLENGKPVDLLHLKPEAPSHEKPAHGYAAYKSHHWFKYFSRINYDRSKRTLGKYFCNAWEEKYPDMPVKRMTMTVYHYTTPLPADPPAKKKVYKKITYDCDPKRN